MSQVVMLPWVKEIGECTIPIKVSDFEEMRDWSIRIHDAYLAMVEENVRLHKELREIKGGRHAKQV